jgi:hypothetical protein
MNYNAMAPQERKSLLDQLLITHPRFVEAFLYIKRHHNNYRPTRKGICQFLVGPTGAGKTVPLEQYAARFPKEECDGKTIRKVVYVSLIPRSDFKSAAVEILSALGIWAVDNFKYTKLLTLVVWHLREQKVELLIIDEFQHCVEGVTNKRAWEGADLVKEILDKARCQVLCAGLSEAADATEVNPQLARRSSGTFYLLPYSWENKQDREDFQAAMAEADRRLPFKRRAGLDMGEMLNALHIAGDGWFPKAMDLIKHTAECVIDDGGPSPVITMASLYDFYKQWKRVGDDVNPFKEHPDTVRCRLAEDYRQSNARRAREEPDVLSGIGAKQSKKSKRPGHVPKSKMNFARNHSNVA